MATHTENHIHLLTEALQRTLKRAGVIKDDAFPEGPELLNVAESYYDFKVDTEEIPDSKVVAAYADMIAKADEDEKVREKAGKFRRRCSSEITRATRLGNRRCNFYYYKNEIYPSVLIELTRKGYQHSIHDEHDDRHQMVVINWSHA